MWHITSDVNLRKILIVYGTNKLKILRAFNELYYKTNIPLNYLDWKSIWKDKFDKFRLKFITENCDKRKHAIFSTTNTCDGTKLSKPFNSIDLL